MLSFFRKSKPETVLTDGIVRNLQNTRQARIAVPESSGRIACVIALLQDQPVWDYAIDKESAQNAAIYASNYMGFLKPYDAEEQQLLDYLTEHFAGRKMAMFAFGLYADLLREAESRAS